MIKVDIYRNKIEISNFKRFVDTIMQDGVNQINQEINDFFDVIRNFERLDYHILLNVIDKPVVKIHLLDNNKPFGFELTDKQLNILDEKVNHFINLYGTDQLTNEVVERILRSLNPKFTKDNSYNNDVVNADRISLLPTETIYSYSDLAVCINNLVKQNFINCEYRIRNKEPYEVDIENIEIKANGIKYLHNSCVSSLQDKLMKYANLIELYTREINYTKYKYSELLCMSDKIIEQIEFSELHVNTK